MLSTLILSAALFSAFTYCTSSPTESSCSDDVHLACTNKPFHDALHDDGFSLLQDDTLTENCGDILADIECKRNYLSACDPSGFEAFALATDGIRNVLRDLCNETSELRRSYRSHSSCLTSATDVYEDCIMNTVDDVGDVDENDANGDIASSDATVTRMCRFYEPFKFCVTQATRNICGDSAAQLVEQIIVRAASPAIDEKCPKQR